MLGDTSRGDTNQKEVMKMAYKKPTMLKITEWNCGVIQGHFENEERVATPKFIYKVDNARKTCYWATLDQLYKYGLEPLTKKFEEWDDTFVGLSWNMNLVFLCPKMSCPANPDPLPLDENGIIPDDNDEEVE